MSFRTFFEVIFFHTLLFIEFIEHNARGHVNKILHSKSAIKMKQVLHETGWCSFAFVMYRTNTVRDYQNNFFEFNLFFILYLCC